MRYADSCPPLYSAPIDFISRDGISPLQTRRGLKPACRQAGVVSFVLLNDLNISIKIDLNNIVYNISMVQDVLNLNISQSTQKIILYNFYLIDARNFTFKS
jgi:hypothetical protein